MRSIRSESAAHSTFLATVFAAVLTSAPLASHAQVVGRTLVSVGDVVAVRGAQTVPLRAGSEVQVGDTLRLGRDSNAQVRLNDESIIALRSETEFRIERFQFRNDPKNDSALFRLIRGGMRTVTGLVGRVNHDAYRLDTPVGYVGIRGTHYNVVQCDTQCLNRDGSVAPRGAYGGVSDGRIAVVNQAGEKVFGHNEYFYVASIAAAPQSLIAPPSFLRDRLEGQVRTSAKQAQAGAQASAPGSSGTTSDARASTAEPVAAAAPVATTTVYIATEQRSASGGLTAVPGSGLVFYPWTTSATVRDSAGNTGTLLTNGGVAIDFGQKKLFAALNLTVGGVEWNVGTPTGIPLVSSANGATFSATFNQSDFQNDTVGHCSQCAGSGLTQPGGRDFRITSMTISGSISDSSAVSMNATLNSANLNSTVSVSGLTSGSTPFTLDRMVALTARNGGGGFSTTSEPGFPVNATFDSNRELVSLRGIAGPWVADRGNAAHQIVGSSSVGDLVWGTWTGAGAKLRTNDYVAYPTDSTDTEHYIHGAATSNIPTSLGSSVNYSPIGGVVNGGTGTFNGGTINVDFLQQRASLINLSASRASGETYVMNGTSGFSGVTPSFDGKFASVTCSGGSACSGPMNGSYSGFLAGPNAEGIGLAFNAGNGVQGVSGAQAFKR